MYSVGLLVLMIATEGKSDKFMGIARRHQIGINTAYAALAHDPPDLAGLTLFI